MYRKVKLEASGVYVDPRCRSDLDRSEMLKILQKNLDSPSGDNFSSGLESLAVAPHPCCLLGSAFEELSSNTKEVSDAGHLSIPYLVRPGVSNYLFSSSTKSPFPANYVLTGFVPSRANKSRIRIRCV